MIILARVQFFWQFEQWMILVWTILDKTAHTCSSPGARSRFCCRRRNPFLGWPSLWSAIGGVANHWRLKYTEVQSQQMAFTQSPSLRNNPKILNNDSTVPSLQMTLYVFGFVLCFVIKMTTIFDLMSQGWSVLWWGWWKFGDETDDNDQIDDKRKISPVDGPWQPSRLCTNLGRDTLTTHFRKYRYLFGELPKLARLSLWGLLLYTS